MSPSSTRILRGSSGRRPLIDQGIARTEVTLHPEVAEPSALVDELVNPPASRDDLRSGVTGIVAPKDANFPWL